MLAIPSRPPELLTIGLIVGIAILPILVFLVNLASPSLYYIHVRLVAGLVSLIILVSLVFLVILGGIFGIVYFSWDSI